MRNCSISLIFSDGAYGFNNVIRVKASCSVVNWNKKILQLKTFKCFLVLAQNINLFFKLSHYAIINIYNKLKSIKKNCDKTNNCSIQ